MSIKKGEIDIGDYYYTIGGNINPLSDSLNVYKFKLTEIVETQSGQIHLMSIEESEHGISHCGTIGTMCYKSIEDISATHQRMTHLAIKKRELEILKLQEEIERLKAEKIQLKVFDRQYNPNL